MGSNHFTCFSTFLLNSLPQHLVTLHEERVDQVDRAIRRNRRIAMDLREQYSMLSDNYDTDSLEPKMRLPWHWRRSLSWYHRQIAKSIGKLYYTDALRRFWVAEMERRNDEYQKFPEDVIYERMEYRRKRSLYACYQRIHRVLRLARYEIHPVEVPPHMMSYRVASWFDEEQPNITDAIISIVNDEFLIRQGLGFTKNDEFLQRKGFKEQEYMASMAFERYQDLCENLSWEMNKAKREMTRDAAINECIDLVQRYREQWENLMATWARGEGNIREPLLMSTEHGVQIPRSHDDLWQHMIEHRWDPANHMPQSGSESSDSEEEDPNENAVQDEISDTGSAVED